MDSSRDLEAGTLSLKERIATSDFANYTSLRTLLDPEWKDFLKQKEVDKCKFLIR
jgi:hypothetical protein